MIGCFFHKVKGKAALRKNLFEFELFLPNYIEFEVTSCYNFFDICPNGSRIAHGMFTAGFVSAVLGMKLPGPGCIYMSQEMRFVAPVRFGDTIETVCEVTEIIPEKKRVILSTTCTNQDGKDVLVGKAMMYVPE